MKKSTLGYIFLVLVVVSVLGTGYCWIYGTPNCIGNMTNLIYTLTLIAVVCYTFETTKLREEAQKANITAIRPVVIPYPVPKARTKSPAESSEIEYYISHFRAKNVMKDRVALNIYLLVWDQDNKKFRISKPDVTPRIMVFEDCFDFTEDKFDNPDSSYIKELLPKNASKVVDTIIEKGKYAICCIYSDLDNMGYYIIQYGIKQGDVMRGDPGRVETGSFYL